MVGRNAGEHHDFLGGECGKPLKQHSENGRNKFRVALQYLLGAALQLRFWLHWQRQQGEPWIEINMLAQLLKAQPDHPINKRLQLARQLGWAKLEAPVRHHTTTTARCCT